MQKKNNTQYSIFLKLFVLFLIFIVLANIALGLFVSWIFGKGPPGGPGGPGGPEKFHRVLSSYAVKVMGSPPDTSAAALLSSELDIKIRIESPDFIWKNDESIPDSKTLLNERAMNPDKDFYSVRIKGRPFTISRSGQNIIIISPLNPREDLNETKVIIYVVSVITILAVLLYFSLRWIFGPIKKLTEGVEKISEGDFESTVIVERRDELGNLADSINEMKVNISNMIKLKESLLIDVSHELRSPLTRIKLANEFIEDPKIQNKIREDVKEMELMISELLDTYRTEKINSRSVKEKTSLSEIVTKVISKFPKGNVVFIGTPGDDFILADIRKIETAVLNITDNAVKYSEGKPVYVKVFRNIENEVCLSVKDSGRGIDESELGKIFEPFYRIDKSRDKKIKGYGLGLSLVRKILNDHDAVIDVKSRKNEGTEFTVTFPKQKEFQ